MPDNDLTRYLEIRPRIDTFDLIQWSSDTVLGKLIQWGSGSHINHSGVALYLTDKGCSTVDRRWTMEALGRGFYPNPLSERLRRHKGQVWWHPLRVELHKKRPLLWSKAWNYDSTGYDFLGLLKNAFGYVRPNANRLFCSEAVYLCGMDAYLPTSWDELKAPRPGDMLKLGWWYEIGVPLL